MRLIFLLVSVCFFIRCSTAQQTTSQQSVDDKSARHPKLIVGITVDQMRYDFISKYWEDFGANGFKKLVSDGFSCNNLLYNYMPTYTGPGHASIFTGTTPAYHGIVANDWYERDTGLLMYCSKDSKVSGVGTSSSAGQMSPIHLLSSTIGDELKLFFNERSKVFGISMKDRGAILPAGRMADAAYWYVGGEEGNWVTSSWYINQLPAWVNKVNAQKAGDKYLKLDWNLLKPKEAYDESMGDNNQYELPFKGTIKPVFPYRLDSLRTLNGNYDLLKSTPWANQMTVEFAQELIMNESMGIDDITDMLCVSFSATDYIGHQFGIHSMELQDCYLRLDEQLASFIAFLDKNIGEENYLLFLTADHGGAPTPSYIMSEKGAAGYFKSDSVEYFVEQKLIEKYGMGDWVLNESNQNIFLNHTLISTMKIPLHEIQNETVIATVQYPNVLNAFSAYDLASPFMADYMSQKVQLGFSQKLSGDVIYNMEPGWMQYTLQGTTHGSPFDYDTHVPALFFGFGISAGSSFEPHSICDIAPTICAVANISFPNANVGKPILKILE